MKNRKLISMLISLVLVFLVAVSVTADGENAGTVSEARNRLNAYDDTKPIEERVALLDSLVDYLYTVNSAEEGYEELVKDIDQKEMSVAKEYLNNSKSNSQADGKAESMKALYSFLAKHPFTDAAEGDANFFNMRDAELSATLNLFVTESEGLSTAQDKHARLDAMMAFANAVDVLPEGELLVKLSKERLECAKLYLKATESCDNNATLGIAIRELNYFVKSHPISAETEGYDVFKESYDKALADFEAKKKVALDKIMLGVHASDWTCAPVINLNFNSADNVEEPKVSVGNIIADKNDDGSTFIGVLENTEYYTVRYDVPGIHYRTTAYIQGISGSMVFEMDITTFGKLPNTDKELIWVENGSPTVLGKQWDQVYFSINKNGDIVQKLSSDNVILKNAITPGEWLRLSLVVGLEDNKVDVYADYELIASYDIADPTYGYTYKPSIIRIGTNPALAGGQFSIDNVKLYQGYAPRDLDYFATLEPEEQFALLVDRITAVENNSLRKEYYDAAIKLLGDYWDGEAEEYLTDNAIAQAAVDKLVGFDLDSLNAALAEDNLEALEAVVDKLTSYERAEDTYNPRSYYLEYADKVNLSVSSLVTAGERYDACIKELNRVRLEISEENQISEFVAAVDAFYHASSLDGLESAFALSNSLVEKINLSLIETGNFPKLAEFYDKYLEMEGIIEDKREIESSKKLLSVLTFLSNYDTEAEWNENYEYLYEYIHIIMEIVDEDNFDPYYGGAKDELEKVSGMLEYFRARIRVEHVNYLSSELARYEASTIYFERFGILANLNEYIVKNKVDIESADIAPLKAKIDACIESLKGEREEYDALVQANTAAFKEKCKSLVGLIDYATMRRICDEASVYFYAMDVRDAAAQDAVNIYIARCRELEAIEDYANEFKEKVSLLAIDKGNVLEGIIECSEYISSLEAAAPGAQSALSNYQSICNNYNNEVNKSNSELEATRLAVGYLSNRTEINSFIAFVVNEIGR